MAVNEVIFALIERKLINNNYVCALVWYENSISSASFL